ncbi:MAG TPA: alkaline phosphatase family protein [Gaiellaceae bacterium]
MAQTLDTRARDAAASRRAFDHILVIMFENQYRSYVLSNPYMRQLSRQGIELRNYFGVMHPSQTNYIASIAGALCNVTNDERPELIEERTIVDLIEEAPGQLAWKAYMDSYVPLATPWTPDLVPQDAMPYFIKHNPFSSFAGVVRNAERWKRIESDSALFSDLLNGEFPEYAWFTPNIWNDGHWVNGTLADTKPRAPTLVDQLAAWLEDFFGRLRFPGPDSHLPPRTLVVVTFDEADFEQDYEPGLASVYDGPNQAYTVLLGEHIEPGVEHEGYNHYSLLRTIEENFGLGDLGKNDVGANWFQFLWHRHFRWGPACSTPIGAGDQRGLSATGFAGTLFVGYASADGTMRVCTRTADPVSPDPSGRWSEYESLTIDGSGGAAMASTEEALVLVAHSAAGALQCLTYDLQNGWSTSPEVLSREGTSRFALGAFDGGTRVMLAFADGKGKVSSRVWDGLSWSEAIHVPAATTCANGGLTLGSLGSSLYLILQAPDGEGLNVVSYNTAPFNIVSVEKSKFGGRQDDTAIERWSPTAFPVAHFSARPDAIGERQPDARPYRTAGPMAVATLDGVMHLVHPGPANPLLLTETFSIAGVMTPSRPVSFKTEDWENEHNGFGTLAEAGWSRQAPIFDARCEPGGELAIARAGEELLLLCRPRPGAPVEIRIGRYEKI